MKVRHWIAVLLVLIVPLQLSWGTVSAYCLHEEGAAQTHFGHHAHQHADSTGEANAAKALGGVDSDCAGCHLHGVTALPATAMTHAIAGVARERHVSPSVIPTSRANQPPERPQWPRLA